MTDREQAGPLVAIVGAGVAGLACARALLEHGVQVRLFDKGRGPGGRLSTRRASTPLGEIAFDHGAQFATARDPGFIEMLERLGRAGFSAPWTGPFGTVTADGQISVTTGSHQRWVGTPGMNGLVKGMLWDLRGEAPVCWGLRIAPLPPRPADQVVLQDETGAQLGTFDAVAVAVPAEQVADLVSQRAPGLAAEARVASSDPCWAAMALFGRAVAPDWPSGLALTGGPISWAARETGKPGRQGRERWILHASPDWSRDHLEDDPDAVGRVLAAAFSDITGAGPAVWVQAHRWRFAQVSRSAGSAFALDWSARVGVCGDWRLGGRIEAAWLSGRHLGLTLCSRLVGAPPPPPHG
jgi:renalase